MKMENKNLAFSLLLIIVGCLILCSCNSIAMSLKDMYLSDKGFGELMETKIFENFANMVLIVGGILFYKGINLFTDCYFYDKNKKNKY